MDETTEDRINIPEALLDAAQEDRFRIEFTETLLLSWWLIDGWAWGESDTVEGKEWKQIHDCNFKNITTNNHSRAKARQWLEERGFIEIRKVDCPDGIKRNRREKGKFSQQYIALNPTSLIPYRLHCKTLDACLPVWTGKDQASQQTRTNIGKLSKKKKKTSIQEEKTTEKNRSRDQQSVLMLERNRGKVGRGYKVNRLYSPWTAARKVVRESFDLEGDLIASLDLRAAQPTLMAALAQDEKMLADCQSDTFYRGLADFIGAIRDDAKSSFYAYSFGPIRSVGTKQPQALEVQTWMRENYPETATFVDAKKQNDYRKFACEMQDREALIFVDGIFQELTEKGLTALTVHDSICFREQDREQATEIAMKHLNKHIKGGMFHLDQG